MVNKNQQKQSFIKLKNHKENFKNDPKCRIINPGKSEIRILIKIISIA